MKSSSPSVRWILQDTASLLATVICLSLTVLTALHLISERTAIAEELTRLSRQGEEIRIHLEKLTREFGSLSPENNVAQKREVDELGVKIAAERSKEDQFRQKSDTANLNIREAEKEQKETGSQKSNREREWNDKLTEANRRAQEKGLKISFPFDAGPDPTGGHYVKHPYDYMKWKGRKEVAEELNGQLGPIKDVLNKVIEQSAEVDRKLKEFQRTHKDAVDALQKVRAGISEFENRKAELLAILANPEARKLWLEKERREAEKSAEEIRLKVKSSGTTRALTFIFHLPMLLWLAVLTVQNAVRLLVFRNRLPDVTLDHAN